MAFPSPPPGPPRPPPGQNNPPPPPPGPPPGPTSGINPNGYYALDPTAAGALIGGGQTVYQSGSEAIQWAQAHGQSTAGMDPNAYYALSPEAANAIQAAGDPVYQSGQTALNWQRTHSGTAPNDPNNPGAIFNNLPAGVDRNAFAYLNNVLSIYGLSSLQPFIISELVNGVPQEQVTLDLYQRPEFKQRFPAIEQRRAAGLPPISPTDYINLEDAYTQVLHNAGMPRGFYDDHATLSNFIAQDVSPTEFKSRVDQGFEAINMAPPEVQQAFQNFYGPSGKAALASYILDPKIATPVLLQHAQAAEIAGTGAEYGFGQLSQGLSERAAQQGVSTQQAQTAFQKGSNFQSLLHGAISDTQPFGAEKTAAGLLGTQPGAEFALQQAIASKQADFSGSGGAQQTQTGVIGAGRAQSL